MFVKFDNGEKYTIKEALNKKYITPAQLKAKGYTNDEIKSSEKQALKYLILRPNCKLYSKWDDKASLIF